MKSVRVLFALLAALAIIALPCAVQANDTRLFVESGIMSVRHHTQDCHVPLNQPKKAICVIYPAKFALVAFVVPNKINGCVIRIDNVHNQSVDWRVSLRNEPPNLTLKCTWHLSGNTLIVQPPIH